MKRCGQPTGIAPERSASNARVWTIVRDALSGTIRTAATAATAAIGKSGRGSADPAAATASRPAAATQATYGQRIELTGSLRPAAAAVPVTLSARNRVLGRGNLVWGARTTTLDPDWKYVNVRRLFIFAEKSIEKATQWVVFEPNDEPLWARVRRNVSAFLTRLWMDGMLQGRTKEEAYFVRCDRTTMTQADINNGKLIVLIGMAPVKPTEFVIFRIGQWTGGSEVSE